MYGAPSLQATGHHTYQKNQHEINLQLQGT